jgi:hypothetical protein
MNKVFVTEGTKKCSVCGAVKVAEAFFKNTNSVAGLSSGCKTCLGAQHKAWYDVHSKDPMVKARQRNWQMLHYYGIDQKEFDRMLAEQGGKCKICKDANPGTKGWALDHNHTTKEVRGILCQACNKLLGFAKDNPAVLREAANYLDKSVAMAAKR